jgi:hypothetical protein
MKLTAWNQFLRDAHYLGFDIQDTCTIANFDSDKNWYGYSNGHDNMWSGSWIPVFRRSIPPLSSDKSSSSSIREKCCWYTVVPTYQTTRCHDYVNLRSSRWSHTHQVLTVRHSRSAEASTCRARTQWLNVSCAVLPHSPACHLLQGTELTLLQRVPSWVRPLTKPPLTTTSSGLTFLIPYSNAGWLRYGTSVTD